MTYQSVNPFSGEVGKAYATHTEAELEAAVIAAHHQFSLWRETSFSQRSEIVMRGAGILRYRQREFALLATEEMGKLFIDAMAEVALSADILEYYAKHAHDFLADVHLHPRSGQATIHSEPLGVLLGVQPWNFPYYQLARFAAPNLMAGNVVLAKHAENVPQCAAAFELMWVDAGAPKGCYTNLRITHEQVARLIDDPRVRGVALTGGVEAGRSVAERAGRSMKKCTMELGGNDAFIVLDDADFDKTLRWAVWAKMNNNGQCCVAGKRFIIMDKIADRFIPAFCAALEELVPGDPMDPETMLAPMSSVHAADALLVQIQRAVDHGAKVLVGGTHLAGPGAYVAPTVLIDVDRTNPVFHEELFGPVALVFRVKTEDEAVALANDSSYGLGAAVFSRDVGHAKRLAERIDCGMVFINHPTWTSPELPFGGTKESGFGRELSALGIHEFINKKLVRVAPIGAGI